MVAMGFAGEYDRCIRRLLEQRQAGAGEREGRDQGDPHLGLPLFQRLQVQRGEIVELMGAVEQTVESLQMVRDGAGERFQAAVVCDRKIIGKLGWFGSAGGDDFVVYGFEFGFIACEQRDGGAMARKRQAGGAAEAGACTSDEDDAVCEKIGAREIVFHSCSSNAPADCTPLCVALSSVAGYGPAV